MIDEIEKDLKHRVNLTEQWAERIAALIEYVKANEAEWDVPSRHTLKRFYAAREKLGLKK